MARAALGGFVSDLRGGKSEAEAFANVLASMADKLINSGLDQFIDGISVKQGTLGGALFGDTVSFNFKRST